MKQAQLQHPMNWILILFAGFFFLLLFLSIANTMTRSASQADDVKTISRTINAIEATRAAPGTTYEINFDDLRTSCEEQFSVELSGQIRSLTGHPLFAQETLDARTKMWSTRFVLEKPITTITYLFDETTTIHVAEQINNNIRAYLLEHFEINLFDQEDLPESFSGTNTIILTDGTIDMSSVSLRSGQQMKILSFNPGANRDRGTITYNNERDNEMVYPSKEFLLAAIITTNPQTYTCGLNIAQERVHFLSTLLAERAQTLNDNINNPLCEEFYTQGIEEYTTLSTTELTSVTQINNIQRALKNVNTQLLANNCPEI